MKKLLYITNIPSPYRVEFWNELSKYYDVTVWFEAKNEANREWKIEGLGRNFKYKFLKSVTLGLDNHFSMEIIGFLNREHFDAYVIGSYSSLTEMLAIMWFKWRKKEFFLNSDGGFPKQENFIKRTIKKFFISKASYWLSAGSNCSEYLMYYGAKKERIHEYPFASVAYSKKELLPLSQEEKKKFREENNLKSKLILTVGQLIQRKGMDILIKAFIRGGDSLKDVTLLIVGSGSEDEIYREMAKGSCTENIVFKPFMQMQDLIPFYKTADVFVLPTRYDIWGLVLNEAMCFGLPVIASDMCGAAKDLIKDGKNGYIVPVENEEALSDRVIELLKDDVKLEVFGNKSREIILGYTIFKMVEAHVRAIEGVGIKK